MEISTREKILLIILLVFAAAGGYYKFIYQNQQQKIQELENKKQDYNLILAKTTNKAMSNKKIKKATKDLNAKITEASEEFFPILEQEKLIVILNGLINESKIENNSLSISDVSVESINIKSQTTEQDEVKNDLKDLIDQLNLYNNEDNEESAKENENNNDSEAATGEESTINVQKINVSMDYKGSYDNFKNFIDKIENFPRKIIIKSLSISSGENDVVMGNMNLDFYVIYKIFEDEFNEWNYEGDYGKYNPFKGGSSADNNKVKSESKKIKYDFSMTVKPTSSDLPTIIMGKADDRSRETYIYADNEGIEDAEIYLTEKDGKYYYKYKTVNYSYPEDFDGEGVEFLPEGDKINLKIYSNIRNSDADMSGINLNVYNKTGKSVYINIESDDKNRPRVNVYKKEGQVIVDR